MRMTPKLLVTVTAAAILSAAAAFAVYFSDQHLVAGEQPGQVAFPPLETRANDVAAIEIKKGGKVLEIAREGDRWIARGQYGYRVEEQNIRSFILNLSQAELIEPKTRKADKYSLLGLGDPGKEDADARQVRLLDADGKTIVEVILGKKRWGAFGSGKDGTYLRKPGDPQTWLASLDVKATPDISDWVEREFFTVDLKKISSVTIEHPGEEPLTVRRTEGSDDTFELAGLGQDAKLKEGGPKADAVAEAYTGIELEDLRKLESESVYSEQSISRLETDDGLTVTFRHRRDGSDHWLSLAASGSGNAGDRAAKLNARVKGWEFKVPSWKADKLFRRRSDFLETS